jgi:hypothetical protein
MSDHIERASQCQRILDHMRQYGSIAPDEARRLYGCIALSQRRSDLRRAGHDVRTEIIRYTTADGVHKCHAQYHLARPAE